MKRLALIALLACTFPAFALEPCLNGHERSAYPETGASQDESGPDSDVKKAQADILAGRDLNETMAPTAAGRPYEGHPYLDGGNFGKPGCE